MQSRLSVVVIATAVKMLAQITSSQSGMQCLASESLSGLWLDNLGHESENTLCGARILRISAEIKTSYWK